MDTYLGFELVFPYMPKFMKSIPTIYINRLIFDDESTTAPAGVVSGVAEAEFSAVPEPSSLSLLALGAGGLLARRRRKAA